MGWSWVGQFVLAVAHCFLGFLESLPPWQTFSQQTNMEGGGFSVVSSVFKIFELLLDEVEADISGLKLLRRYFLLIVQQMKHSVLAGVAPKTNN